MRKRFLLILLLLALPLVFAVETRIYFITGAPTTTTALYYPTTNINVTQNQFFNFTVNVTCNSGVCGEVNVSLDPVIADVSQGDYTLSNASVGNNFSHITINNQTSPYDSLVFYMPFDTNTSLTKAYDYSRFNNSGDFAGNASYVETNCPIGGCADLDGDGDWISFDDLGDPTCGTTGLTVLTWIRRDDTENDRDDRVIEYGISSADRIWMISGNPVALDGDRVRIRTDTSAGLVTSTSTSTPMTDGVWAHIGLRYDGDSQDIFSNGQPDGTAAQSGTLDCVTTDTIHIGSSPDGYGDIDGAIDEVMIFNTSLTDQQILDIYNNQSSRFYSRGEQQFNNINVSNGTFINVTINSSLYFSSSINVSLGDKSGGGYSFGQEYEFTNGKASNIPISTPTNFSLKFIFYAGNSSNNSFISPNLISSIIMDSNGLSSVKSGLISTVTGATPFYTNFTNPISINLSAGESQLVTFWVNATGTTNITHTFFAYSNLTSNLSISSISANVNITIIEPTSQDTCTPPGDSQWNIEDNCTITTTIQVCPYGMNISTKGSLNITNTGLINTSYYWIYAMDNFPYRVWGLDKIYLGQC